MAVGFGYDIHRLVPGRKLLLGGVKIPHPTGLLGHSDGDVLLHAVIDALLGAAGLGDIGRHFPDTDPKNKGISSARMVEKVMGLLQGRWVVENVDVTVVAEAPRLAPHNDAIRAKVSALVGCPRISIKAKTNEGLGYIGQKEAIACYAVAEIQAIAGRP